MKKFRTLSRIERPREKLAQYGPDKLSNVELLAILLRTGTKTRDVMTLSRIVMRTFAGDSITSASITELQKINGLGVAKACEIVACMEIGRRLLKGKEANLPLTPRDVWKRTQDVCKYKKEHFMVFYLDARSQEICRNIISVGTLTENIVHPREVFEPAVTCACAQIIVAHNHPSGNVEPSKEDLHLTERLVEAGKILGIELIDHIIITKEKYFSFKDAKLL